MKKTKAIIHGNVYTIKNGIIENGTVLIEDGKIAAVGTDIAVPAEAEIIDAGGAIVSPGLIDAHTHMGIEEEIHPEGEDTNEMTEPITAELRAIDGINPFDIGYKDAVKAGVTSVMVAMGSANVIGGLACAMKTNGRDLSDMVLKEEAGLKMAFGENPKRVYTEQKKAPTTRMATMALARQAFYDAKTYERKKEEDGFDLANEHILKALKREIPVRLHAHRADDILSAIRLKNEFDLEMVIEHVTDGHLIVEQLKYAGVAAAVGPSLSNRAKVEMENVTFATAGILAKAGIKVALITDHPCTPIAYLPMCAGLAIKHGMTEEDAWKAVTINPAEMLHIDNRVGSIECGKDADIVIWQGHPFTIAGAPKMVLVNGEIAYQA